MCVSVWDYLFKFTTKTYCSYYSLTCNLFVLSFGFTFRLESYNKICVRTILHY